MVTRRAIRVRGGGRALGRGDGDRDRTINAAERELVDDATRTWAIQCALRRSWETLRPTSAQGQLWLISRPSQPEGAPMCFRPAILSLPLLLVFTVAHAQQSGQQNPCFELYRNPSAGIAGALLLKCSGQTWVLIGPAGGPARWYPISTS